MAEVRRDLGAILMQNYFVFMEQGWMASVWLEQENDLGEVIDYSLMGMVTRINSRKDIGLEFLPFISEQLKVSIWIYDIDGEVYVKSPRGFDQIVALVRHDVGRVYYELVGLMTPAGIQTLFNEEELTL